MLEFMGWPSQEGGEGRVVNSDCVTSRPGVEHGPPAPPSSLPGTENASQAPLAGNRPAKLRAFQSLNLSVRSSSGGSCPPSPGQLCGYGSQAGPQSQAQLLQGSEPRKEKPLSLAQPPKVTGLPYLTIEKK